MGYDRQYALAVITIMAFYRDEDKNLISYQSGTRWLPGERHFEETVVLFRREQCYFLHRDLLEFGPREFCSGHIERSNGGAGCLEWGPKRTWDEDQDWKHPAVVQKEELKEKRRREQENWERQRNIGEEEDKGLLVNIQDKDKDQ